MNVVKCTLVLVFFAVSSVSTAAQGNPQCLEIQPPPLQDIAQPVKSPKCTATTINFQAGKEYIIQSSTDDSVIDLKNSITTQKNPIITYPRHQGKNQYWIAKASQAANSFNLITMIPGAIMGALTYDLKDNITMIRYLNDGLSQQWYICQEIGELVQIRSNVRNSNSGNNCLTRTSTGSPMEVMKCEESVSNQLWKLMMA